MIFSADLDRLTTHAEQAHAFAERAEQAAGRLGVVVADLHLTWTGHAGDAHRRAHDGWVRGERELREALVAMTRAVARAHDHYRAAATANAEMWSPLG
ncbi:MAG: WXG100 family type VII secretion target [Nocardioides sp.]